MDCKTCFNSRTGISENGYHTICTLSAWKSAECITQDYKHYMKSPFDIPQKSVTKADRVRSMTDEELAVKMSGLESFALACGGGWPPEKWLNWLKQEAEDGE